MRRLLIALPLTLVVLALAASPASAHVGQGSTSGFLSGFVHPISGLDHILAMVAVGLWGAQLGRPAIWVLPVAFPMMMAFGGLMGLLAIPLPGVEIGIAVSALVLGAMVLLEARLPIWVAAILVGIFAVFHGHAHGAELPPGADGLTYSLGFVIATGLLHAFGITIGLVHRFPSGRLALRGAGAVIALAGPYFLFQALA